MTCSGTTAAPEWTWWGRRDDMHIRLEADEGGCGRQAVVLQGRSYGRGLVDGASQRPRGGQVVEPGASH